MMSRYLRVPANWANNGETLGRVEINGAHDTIIPGAQWASLGVDLDKNPGGYFLDKLCYKLMFFNRFNLFL